MCSSDLELDLGGHATSCGREGINLLRVGGENGKACKEEAGGENSGYESHLMEWFKLSRVTALHNLRERKSSGNSRCFVKKMSMGVYLT